MGAGGIAGVVVVGVAGAAVVAGVVVVGVVVGVAVAGVVAVVVAVMVAVVGVVAGVVVVEAGVGVKVSNTQRRKGLEGEREVAAIWRAYGFDVRGLETGGDHTVIRMNWRKMPLILHSEVKRTEVARPWQWIAQAEREAPESATAVVAFRRSRSKWYALISLEDLARLLA